MATGQALKHKCNGARLHHAEGCRQSPSGSVGMYLCVFLSAQETAERGRKTKSYQKRTGNGSGTPPRRCRKCGGGERQVQSKSSQVLLEPALPGCSLPLGWCGQPRDDSSVSALSALAWTKEERAPPSGKWKLGT